MMYLITSSLDTNKWVPSYILEADDENELFLAVREQMEQGFIKNITDFTIFKIGDQAKIDLHIQIEFP